MFRYQLINHPESFILDELRIDRIFELVSVVPHASVIARNEAIQVSESHKKTFQNGILNIAFLSDEEIQVLNREHRGIDKTTDVLSFHYYDDFSGLSADDVAGEIILSESRILAQALEHGHTPQRECEILVLHSILHIIGYDHETDEDYEDMWKWEGELRKELRSYDLV
jgi:probable rRNA maturation factor